MIPWQESINSSILDNGATTTHESRNSHKFLWQGESGLETGHESKESYLKLESREHQFIATNQWLVRTRANPIAFSTISTQFGYQQARLAAAEHSWVIRVYPQKRINPLVEARSTYILSFATPQWFCLARCERRYQHDTSYWLRPPANVILTRMDQILLTVVSGVMMRVTRPSHVIIKRCFVWNPRWVNGTCLCSSFISTLVWIWLVD